MQAIATAMARAIAEISASCDIQGDTTACVVSEADITTTATVRPTPLPWRLCSFRCTGKQEILCTITIPTKSTAPLKYRQAATSTCIHVDIITIAYAPYSCGDI